MPQALICVVRSQGRPRFHKKNKSKPSTPSFTKDQFSITVGRLDMVAIVDGTKPRLGPVNHYWNLVADQFYFFKARLDLAAP